LVIYPANIIVESYLYAGWEKTKKRQMCKNFTRGLLIAFTIVLALIVYNKLESFLSIIGSLTCTPIAFILPAMFHYKACATTL
jgi:proton-coupled amino acid transporter